MGSASSMRCKKEQCCQCRELLFENHDYAYYYYLDSELHVYVNYEYLGGYGTAVIGYCKPKVGLHYCTPCFVSTGTEQDKKNADAVCDYYKLSRCDDDCYLHRSYYFADKTSLPNTNEEKKSKYLILAITGACDPPPEVKHVKRNKNRVTYQEGVKQDIMNMKSLQKFKNVEAFVLDTTSTSTETVTSFLITSIQSRKDKRIILYYTGHGEIGTGNWCFSNSTLSPVNIKQIFEKSGVTSPLFMIISDSCFSGQFCLESIKIDLCLNANASSHRTLQSRDSVEGGVYTYWLFHWGSPPRAQKPESFRRNPENSKIIQWKDPNSSWKDMVV